MIQTEGRPKFLMLNRNTEADCGKHFVLILMLPGGPQGTNP